MKKATYALVSIALCFAGCKSTSIQEKSDSTPIPGIDAAKQYLAECKASETNPSLGLFGWSEVNEYWNRVPELQALRDAFEEADEALDNAFMKDAEYRAAYDEYKDSTGGHFNQEKYDEFGKVYSVVRSRLMQDEEFRQIRKTRDETLFDSNIQTLEYIINDYEQQEKEFPVDWMAKTIQLSKANAKAEHLREEVYGPWVPVAGNRDQINFESKLRAGMMPLYSKREPGRIREIFIKIKAGSGFHVYGGMSKERLLARNRELVKKGYVVLVVLRDPAEGGYWANWVDRQSYDEYVQELSRLGISPGAIRESINANGEK